MLTENQVIQLRESLNNKGYCQVNNILHSQLKEYLQIVPNLIVKYSNTETQKENKITYIDSIPNKIYYSSPFGETLLAYFTKIYSEISGKNLVPSYSFFRKYFQGNDLKKHIDRPSCQYSATIQINSSVDESWDFFITDKQNQKVECKTKVGDIIFYKGEEVEHWRETLKYEHSSHFFLHWVDKDNPNYKPYHFDGRKSLSSPK